MSKAVDDAIELLECAAWLRICGEDDPVIVAATELDIEFGSKAWNLAYGARSISMRGSRNLTHYVTMLEAAAKLREGSLP